MYIYKVLEIWDLKSCFKKIIFAKNLNLHLNI